MQRPTLHRSSTAVTPTPPPIVHLLDIVHKLLRNGVMADPFQVDAFRRRLGVTTDADVNFVLPNGNTLLTQCVALIFCRRRRADWAIKQEQLAIECVVHLIVHPSADVNRRLWSVDGIMLASHIAHHFVDYNTFAEYVILRALLSRADLDVNRRRYGRSLLDRAWHTGCRDLIITIVRHPRLARVDVVYFLSALQRFWDGGASAIAAHPSINVNLHADATDYPMLSGLRPIAHALRNGSFWNAGIYLLGHRTALLSTLRAIIARDNVDLDRLPPLKDDVTAPDQAKVLLKCDTFDVHKIDATRAPIVDGEGVQVAWIVEMVFV